MYTTDNLIQDCVGQFIEKQPYSINRSSLLNDRQYCQVWTCLLQWTEKQITRGNSFIIPHLGLVKCHGTDDTISESSASKAHQLKWTLFIESGYITEQSGKLGKRTDIDMIEPNELMRSPGIKCHISSLIQYAPSLSESQIQVGLKHIFAKLAQQIQRSATSTKSYSDVDQFERHLKIIINMGWGYLSVLDGVIDFRFTMNEALLIKPNMPTGLRRIPAKYRESTSSLLSVSSVPSGVRIKNPSQQQDDHSAGAQYSRITQHMERMKQQYQLPVDNDFENPLIYLASTDSIPESSHDKCKYPRVLSEFSRTQGSTYCTHTNYEAPSSKIGLFYTPTASLYRINAKAKTIEYTDHLPFFQSDPEQYYAKNQAKLMTYELKYRTQHANEYAAGVDADNSPKSKAKRRKKSKELRVSALDLEIASSCQRYHEYVQNRMGDDFIPPLRDDLIAKILAKLEPDLTLITQASVEGVLSANLSLIQAQNVVAMKTAILDYVLKSNQERARLNILIPPHHIPAWGSSPLPYSAPLSWGSRLQASWNAMNDSSYFVNRGIIEMLSLWQNYKHYSLFGKPTPLHAADDDALDLPPAPTVSVTDNNCTENVSKRQAFTMPMTLQEFRDQQEEHLDCMRNIFVNNWYNDSVLIMKKYVEQNGLDSSEPSTLRLFSAIAAFMSRQLCEIVYRSLNDCVAFFERYKTAPTAVSARSRSASADDEDKDSGSEAEPAQNVFCIEAVPLSTARDVQPLWRIALELSRDGIDFAVPLEDVDAAINDMIEGMIGCFEGISCVEGKIFGLLENVPSLCVYIDDDIRQETRRRCAEITSVFVDEMQYLQQLYTEQFSPLFSANEDLTRRLNEMQSGGDDTDDALSAFKAEIGKYERIREDVSNKAHLRLRMGLFEAECQTINALIMNHAQDLKNGITKHVAKQLIDRAQQLVNSYEDGSKILLKKPETAQELVDLVDYIEKFETSELAEFEDVSDVLGRQLSFLFETDHSLSHDLLRSVGRVSSWNKNILQHKEIADENRVTQRQYIEATISERSKQYELKIKKMYQEVEDLQLLSEIRDTTRIDHIKGNMDAVLSEKVYLNQQQSLLQMEQSEFKICQMLQDAVTKL